MLAVCLAQGTCIEGQHNHHVTATGSEAWNHSCEDGLAIPATDAVVPDQESVSFGVRIPHKTFSSHFEVLMAVFNGESCYLIFEVQSPTVQSS